MIDFENFINEARSKIIYRGTDYVVKKLEPEYMNNMGNNLEGVGVYFSDSLDAAEHFGDYIIKAEINERDFVKSRSPISVLGKRKVVSFLESLHNIDDEEFFYYISDYVNVTNPEDVNKEMISDLYKDIQNQLIKDWQIQMSNIFGVVRFVSLWNKNMKFKGTYNNIGDSTTYVVIDPSLKIETV